MALNGFLHKYDIAELLEWNCKTNLNDSCIIIYVNKTMK